MTANNGAAPGQESGPAKTPTLTKTPESSPRLLRAPGDPDAVTAAAHAYVRRGWRVIPVHIPAETPSGCSCYSERRPLCGPAGKHPVETGWQATPLLSGADVQATFEDGGHNVGIATGAASGFFVLDVDLDKPGTEGRLRDMLSDRLLPATHTVRTPGGWHHYFAMPDFTVTNSARRLPDGVDVRGTGGMVVAPPSVSGKGAYKVATMAPDWAAGVTDAIAAAPDWLLDLVRPLPSAAPVDLETLPKLTDLPESEQRRLAVYTDRVVEGEISRLAECREKGWGGHGWNTTTFEVSCQLIELAHSPWCPLTPQEAHALVLERAPKDAGFTDADVEGCFTSALRTVDGKARALPENRDRGPIYPGDPLSDPNAGPESATDAPVAPVGARPSRPELDVTSDVVASYGLRETLGTGPTSGLFLRSGQLIFTPRVGEAGYIPPQSDGDHDGPAQVRTFNASSLAADLSWRFECYRERANPKTGELLRSPAFFPKRAAENAVEAPHMLQAVRPLRGIVHTPSLRRDGTILDQPGYDAASGWLYLPEPGLTVPPVPERPTQDDVTRARDLLFHMVAGFRFVADHDRANFLGFALTPLLRAMAPPPYKLAAIGAPQPGSGKTLLATLLRTLHGGVFRSEMPSDEAELKKSVTAILDVTTAPVVHIDNVTGVLRSSTLAGLLTSDLWEDRRLGATAMVSRPNDRLWIVTGNNLAIGGDLVRRTVHATIDPGVPNPHLRTDFTIPELVPWVRQHRGELLAALLTLVRAWMTADCPTRGRCSSDGYGRWVEMVDGILGHAGVPGKFDDPSAAPEPVGADDEEWASLLTAIHGLRGSGEWTARDVLAQVNPSTQGFPSPERPIPLELLPADLRRRVEDRHVAPATLARSLGHWLRNRAGRWADDLTVRSTGTNRDGVGLWRIETLDQAHTS